MDQEPLVKTEDVSFDVKVEDLQQLVNGWMQREKGDEEIMLYKKNGGEKWLADSLKTDHEHGISEGTVEAREAHFGSNRKEV